MPFQTLDQNGIAVLFAFHLQGSMCLAKSLLLVLGLVDADSHWGFPEAYF